MNKAVCLSDVKVQGDALYDLVSSMTEGAHIKNINDGTYIFSNSSNLETYGLQEVRDIIGATVYDLDGFMRPFWGKNFAKQIDLLDCRVRYRQETVTDNNRIFLNKSGYVHIQNMTKIPVHCNCSKNKTAAVLTLSFNLTKKTDLFKLLAIYKQAYNKKSEAISYFMRYLKLDKFFFEPLTEKELLCLLSMKQNPSHKSLANRLKVSIKTIETHVSHILQKSKQYKISDILVFLRGNKLST